jgi:dTDP-4-dehydrorhamnose reductase
LRALVIGATGLVGGVLLRELARSGADVVGTYHSRPGAALVRLDATDPSAAERLIAEARPAVIFLPAALTAVDYCESHRDEAWSINVEAPGAIARVATRAHAKIVFFSTEYVFDGRDGPYSEDDPIHPLGIYAQSKAEGERAVREYSDDHLIIRTTVVYGWDRSSKNFAMQVWERLSAGDMMRVPKDQVGNPTLVDFLVETTLGLAVRDVRGTVNVVGLDRVPRTEFAYRLARALDLNERLIEPVSTAALQQVAPRPLNAGLRTDKLGVLLGRPAIGLDAAIDRFLASKRADHVPSRLS